MKKYALILAVAMLIQATAGAADKELNIAVNSETKDITYNLNIGSRESAVPVLTKITDSNGNLNYLNEGYSNSDGEYSFSYNVGNGAGYYKLTSKAGETVLNDEFFVGSVSTVEGESYKVAAITPSTVSHETLSGGKMLAYGSSSYGKWIDYVFNAPVAGRYEVTARTSALGVRWTTDYNFSINKGEVFYPTNYALKQRDYSEYTQSTGLLKEYSLGIFDFNAGENTLRIFIDENDKDENGRYSFNIDCFKFELKGFEFEKISTNDACGVFEKSSDVNISVDFKAAAYESRTYRYTVNNFWGQEVYSGNTAVNEGERKALISLGKVPEGWYRMKVYNDDNELSCVNFCVVGDLSERYSGETPFAADLASTHLVKKSDDLRKMAKAAKLAGVQWMRERISWMGMHTSREMEPYYGEVNEIADILHKNGIKIASTFSNPPEWAERTDLNAIYEMQKKLAENTRIDLWEIENEPEGGSYGTADVYSAYFKAAALGNAAAQNPALISVASQCMDADATYNRLLMQNDTLAYSDIYNFHLHESLTSTGNPVLNTQMLKEHLTNSADNATLPFWLTEAGLYIAVDENNEISDKQRSAQARYNVCSTVMSLASGTQKHFWFIWPQFIENGKEMGTFDKYMNPTPTYQSQAIMTQKLGKGEIKGKLNLTGAEGYLFDSGNGDVAVIWAEKDTKVLLNANQNVEITDIMGVSKILNSENGKVNFTATYYPVYITFNGEADTQDYSELKYEKTVSENKEFTAADKIIINHSIDDEENPFSLSGHMFEYDEEKTMTVTVHNFNESNKSVKLLGILNGYDIVFENDTVEIPAMDKITVKANIIPESEVLENTQMNLTVYAVTDGEVSSPSVSYVTVTSGIKEPDFPVANSGDASAWDVSNIGTGGSAKLESRDGGIHCTVSLTDKNRWFYPQLRVSGNEMAKYDGITFAAKADSTSAGKGSYNIYCYLSDGRSYSLGGQSGISLDGSWIQINRTWEQFVLRSNPNNLPNDTPIDPEKIIKISVGGNFESNNIGYTVKYIGHYKKTVNGEGITILSAWAGENIAKAQLINNSDLTQEFTLVAAVYDKEGRLVSAYSKPVLVHTAHLSYDVNIKGDMHGKTVKLFAWEKNTTLKPIAESVMIER